MIKIGRTKGTKNIKIEEKICFYCQTRDISFFKRYEGKIYCNKHFLHLKRHGEIKSHTLKDSNTYKINEEEEYVSVDVRNINGEISHIFLVDLSDWSKVKLLKWSVTVKHSPYIFNRQRNRTPLHIYLARHIMGLEYGDKRVVDHINGDTLDNRRRNLRIATVLQNQMNVTTNSRSTTGYKGVTFQKNMSKWKASITANKKLYQLGYFDNIEDAIEARKVAEIKLFGEFSREYNKL